MKVPDNWRELDARARKRGRTMDRVIPTFLLDSPLSRAGYLAGTAFGLVWGFLWSRGRVERSHGLFIFRGMPGWTFGRGGVCVGGCFLTGDHVPSEAVLRHEAVHRAQWRRYGLLLPLLYALEGYNPFRNRFEVEADLVDGGYLPRALRDASDS